ncbi:MAG TPA: glycerophosphodiester phosphodiesterase family protein [Pseudorhodoplanes sp.]|jgi:glycerophosphoryl diester phosphodiesterase|nr:glycerophosphodiester phosphodiesterase family protein [Pseudorhodoplanes sp.]
MAPGWLTARPVAHRGLHDAGAGVIENTATAFNAAIANDFAIECDLQITADGEAVVYHDHVLGRLTEGDAPLRTKTAAELKAVVFRNTPDRMMTLEELLALVDGRVPLFLEMKSRFDGDMRLPRRLTEITRGYRGAFGAMSFDPAQVEEIRRIAPEITRGIVAERWYVHQEWAGLSSFDKQVLGHLLHAPRTRPQFVNYAVKDLPAAAPLIARYLFGVPLLVWTVRTEADREKARRWANQIVFEGFRP